MKNGIERAEPSRGAQDAHTPGPWEAQNSEVYSGDHCIADSWQCSDFPEEECRANARVIAQAPTLLSENEKLRAGHVALLEALKHALPILIGAIAFVDCKAVVAEVRAAIEQAERT